MLFNLASTACTTVIVLQALISAGLAYESPYDECQRPSRNPLSGCPTGTILVTPSNESSDICKANLCFNSVQDAIQSLPQDNSSQVILILPGQYTEQVNVTRPGPVTLLGQTGDPTQQIHNTVQIQRASAVINGSLPDDAFTAVLTVAPTLDASLTGSGPTGYPVPANTSFGCSRFSVYNIDISNTAANYAIGQALAVSISYANAGFYRCGIYSYQDTVRSIPATFAKLISSNRFNDQVYVGKLGNAYFFRNEIAGEVDFLYGFGTAWFEQSNLLLRGCGGGITAWKGSNTTYTNKFGVYISRSAVYASNSTIAESILGQCYLGRPWNDQHRSVFMNTRLDASIAPQGYRTWDGPPYSTDSRYDNNTLMAEYHDNGAGFNLRGRLEANITKLLTSDQVQPYRSPEDVYMTSTGAQPNIAWIDPATYPWHL